MNMSISQRTSILLDTLETEPIPKTTIQFFCRTNQNRYHSMLLRLLKESGLTQKKVADKLGVDKGQINRWLSSASNLTINTFTKLMLAMGADLDDPSYTSIADLVAHSANTGTVPELSPRNTEDCRSKKRNEKNRLACFP